MHALTSSSEKLLQVRLSLGSYETLFSVGKDTDGLLAAAHKLLEASNEEFRVYMAGPFGSDEERTLAQTVAQTVAQARTAPVNQAIEPEYKALVDNDFNTFRTIQGETADRFYSVYARAIDALKRAQADNRQRQSDQLSKRFAILTGLFIAIGVAALVVGAMARAGLSAGVVKPVNQTSHLRDPRITLTSGWSFNRCAQAAALLRE